MNTVEILVFLMIKQFQLNMQVMKISVLLVSVLLMINGFAIMIFLPVMALLLVLLPVSIMKVRDPTKIRGLDQTVQVK